MAFKIIRYVQKLLSEVFLCNPFEKVTEHNACIACSALFKQSGHGACRYLGRMQSLSCNLSDSPDNIAVNML